MPNRASVGDPFVDSALTMAASDMDTARGRKRDRSPMRATGLSPIPIMRPDQSSTLRGRSRQRADSPRSRSSRNASPTVISPSKHRLLYSQLRSARREHCPSRGVSPNKQESLRRSQRTRSRSRGPRIEQESRVMSSLRNEVLRDRDADTEEET